MIDQDTCIHEWFSSITAENEVVAFVVTQRRNGVSHSFDICIRCGLIQPSKEGKK